jgi:hypothetical protein
MTVWTVVADPFPFAPDETDVVGSVVALDRTAALEQAKRLHGPDVLVVNAKHWPTKKAEA